MRWLYLVAFCCASSILCAQEKEIRLSEKGVTSNVDKNDLINPVKDHLAAAKDSILLGKDKKFADSLRNLINKVDGQRIYSQKQWKQFSDSLKKLPLANAPELQQLMKTEISEKELIDLLNQKFAGAGNDSVVNSANQKYADGLQMVEKNKQKVEDKKQELERAQQKFDDNKKNISSLGEKIPSTDLDQLKLPQSSLLDLSPLPGRVLKSKYVKQLDSIRRINLKEQGLQFTEKQVDAQQKLAAFSKKPSLLDKSYFEGVIGFAPGNLTLIQASPTLGYHFTDYLSLGAGPNILIREQQKKIVTTVGLKAFFKAEFFKRQGYIQLEDIMDSYGISADGESSKSFYEQHNIFVGGGWLLSISAPLTLNFSLLYCVNKDEVVGHEFSPMVFRVGLSSIKIKK
jgi:hypothetical protein